ncbi:MAG: O-antigen ligase family protein [Bacillota bacterium]
MFPTPKPLRNELRIDPFGSSHLLRTLTGGAWLLLLPLSAYPLIDYVLRLGKTPGGLAGTWDDLLLLGGLVLVAARIAYRGLDAYRKTDLHLPLLVYFGVFLFLLLVRSPETSVGIEGLRVYLEYALWFFVGLNLPDNPRQVKTLMAFFIFFCTVAAVHGIGQYIAGVPVPASWVDQAEAGVRCRAFSVVGSPNVLGSLMALAIPVGIAGCFSAAAIRPRAAYALATVLMAICLFLTFSRGAWFAAFVGLIIFSLMRSPRLLLAVAVISIGAPIVSPGVAGRILYLFSSGYAASSQRDGRISRWQAAFEKVHQHPFVGEGFGRFGGAVATRAIPGNFYVDNFYLKTAAESGLIGLATLAFIVVSVWRAGYRAFSALSRPVEKTLAAALLSGLSAVLMHNLVENIFETPLMSTLFWLFIGLLLCLPRIEAGPPPE